MCCPSSDPEDQIKSLLLGDEKDIGDGIDLIHRNYGEAICCWILHYFCSLSPDDVADAWQDALLGIAQMAINGQFRRNGSVFALVSSIMRWRSIDVLNANTRHQQTLQKYRENVTYTDEVTEVAPLFVDEVFHLICEAIETLSPRQKLVWEVYRDCGFAVRDLSELVKAVEDLTGVSQSHDSVRRARQEGREKIRKYLRRKGYGL